MLEPRRSTYVPTLIAGASAVALVLFGTRWGSYIGVAPLFLTDILLGAATVHYLLGMWRAPRPALGIARLPILILACSVWVIARFVLGANLGFEAIRDFAPYLYIAVAILGWHAAMRATEAEKSRTVKLLTWALALHAAWYTAQALVPTLPLLLPQLSAAQDLHVFSPRPDVDCALIGVLAGLLLTRALEARRWRFLNLLGFAACWGAILLSMTRAGVLGAATATALAIVLVLAGSKAGKSRKLELVSVAPLILVAFIAIVPTTDVGTKFLATLDPSLAASSTVAEGAAGTTRARSNAWDAVAEWTLNDPQRAIVGVGFGPNFLVDSGASILLVSNAEGGEDVPRSPHNFWIGTFARLGAVGLALVGAAVVMALGRTWRSRRVLTSDPLALLTALIPAALLIPATFGVVLESPFAAVPFWWSIGVSLALYQRRAGTADFGRAIPARISRARSQRPVSRVATRAASS
jgi:O-antigen ligase